MKKLIVILICIVVVLSFSLCGCSDKNVSLYVPDGAPALAVANIADAEKVGDTAVETIVTTGEDVVAKCATGEADMAILPTNAALTICNKRSDYLLYSVNVHGLLYVVGTKQIDDITALQGAVYSIGLGNTPEYVFKTVLDHNNVDYSNGGAVQLQYFADASSIVPLLLQAAQKGETKFAVLGEPAVSNLLNKAAEQNKDMFRLFDLQRFWQQAVGSDTLGYPQASLIVKKDLLSNDAFAASLERLIFENDDFLKQNLSTLNDLMKSIGSNLDVNYTAEIIDKCNLKAVFAKDVKTDIETYLGKFAAMQQYLPISQNLFYE